VLFGDLKSSTEVVCQLLEETIQTIANDGLTLHTLIHTFPLENRPQYLRLNQEQEAFNFRLASLSATAGKPDSSKGVLSSLTF
jgi:hypothetical protein